MSRHVRQLWINEHAPPDQVRKPTARPTLRWLVQYFEGLDLLHIARPDGSRVSEILRVDSVHQLV